MYMGWLPGLPATRSGLDMNNKQLIHAWLEHAWLEQSMVNKRTKLR